MIAIVVSSRMAAPALRRFVAPVLIGAAALGWSPAGCVTDSAKPSKPIPTPPGFQEQLQRAERDMKTKAGAKYDVEMGEQFAKKNTKAVQECVQSGGPPPYAPIRFIVVVDKDGAVSQVLASPDVPAAMCIMALLQKERFSKPPFAPFHDLILMTFQDQ